MSTRTSTTSQTQKFNTTATQERRRRPRLDSDAAGFLLCDDEVNDESQPQEVRVFDLSRMGVGFTTEQQMEIGSICRIRIGYGPMRLARRMRVKRCERSDAGYKIGAEFA